MKQKRVKVYFLAALGIVTLLAVTVSMLVITVTMEPPSEPPTKKQGGNYVAPFPRDAQISAHPDIIWEQFLDAGSKAAVTLRHGNFIYVIGTISQDNIVNSIFITRLKHDGTVLTASQQSATGIEKIIDYTLIDNYVYVLAQNVFEGKQGFCVFKISFADLTIKAGYGLGSVFFDEFPLFIKGRGNTLYVGAEYKVPGAFSHTLLVYEISTALKQVFSVKAQRSAKIDFLRADLDESCNLIIWASAKAALSGYPTIFTYSASRELTWQNVDLSYENITVYSVTPTDSGYLLTASNDDDYSSALTIALNNSYEQTNTRPFYITYTDTATAFCFRHNKLLYFGSKGGGLYFYDRLSSPIPLYGVKGYLRQAVALQNDTFLTVCSTQIYTALYKITPFEQKLLSRVYACDPVGIFFNDSGAIVVAHKNNKAYIMCLPVN